MSIIVCGRAAFEEARTLMPQAGGGGVSVGVDEAGAHPPPGAHSIACGGATGGGGRRQEAETPGDLHRCSS